MLNEQSGKSQLKILKDKKLSCKRFVDSGGRKGAKMYAFVIFAIIHIFFDGKLA